MKNGGETGVSGWLRRNAAAMLSAAAIFYGLGATAADADLAVAKHALRDGLWEMARSRAAASGAAAGLGATLESHARQGKWSDILAATDAEETQADDTAACYRAVALLETGRHAEAAKLLEGRKFAGAAAETVQLLLAQAAMASGDTAKAAEIAKAANFAGGGADAQMTAAEILRMSGDAKGAAAIWRRLAESSAEEIKNGLAVHASVAARNLGEAALLASVYGKLDAGRVKNETGLALAKALMADPKTFDEGAALARKTATADPGAEGARDTFLAYADACLERKAWMLAAEAYREAIEAWPEAAREQSVREGRAWALRKLGKLQEAADEYARAADAAKDDEGRALASMELGDTLAEAGRGDEAMAKYREVLQKFPGTAAAEKLKAEVELREIESKGRELYRNFRFREAQDAFAEVARRDPSRKPRMDYLEMLCLYGQVRDEEAAKKAAGLSTDCPDAKIRAESTLWLAKYSYNAKRWDKSRDLFAAYATNMVPESAHAPEALLWAARAAFACNDFQAAIDLATTLAVKHPSSPEKSQGSLVQGEALAEISRLDEAIVVLERVASDSSAAPEVRRRARLLRADALFAMGADNPARYGEALEGYSGLLAGEPLDDAAKLNVSFKIARTLEKLGRSEEAMDRYYGDVVCAWLDARRRGTMRGEDEKALFVRATFRLADEYEKRGEHRQAINLLRLAADGADGPPAAEAARRIEKLELKGG